MYRGCEVIIHDLTELFLFTTCRCGFKRTNRFSSSFLFGYHVTLRDRKIGKVVGGLHSFFEPMTECTRSFDARKDHLSEREYFLVCNNS